jgi:hypothetical protein
VMLRVNPRWMRQQMCNMSSDKIHIEPFHIEPATRATSI